MLKHLMLLHYHIHYLLLIEDVFNFVAIEFIKLAVAAANCASVAYVASNEDENATKLDIVISIDAVYAFIDAVYALNAVLVLNVAAADAL